MSYGKRLDTLCSHLTEADVFADVGCDHGYCTEYMLKNGLCKKAIISDVSKGSLEKAVNLLQNYISEGKVVSVLGDGFYGVPKTVNEVIIAGMGGREIISILSDKKYGFMPERFVFQPMKDSKKLREYIIENGGFIERDYTFKADKFYDVIVGGVNITGKKQEYTESELEFGKENLSCPNPDFCEHIEILIKNAEKYLLQENMQETSRAKIIGELEKFKEIDKCIQATFTK